MIAVPPLTLHPLADILHNIQSMYLSDFGLCLEVVFLLDP